MATTRTLDQWAKKRHETRLRILAYHGVGGAIDNPFTVSAAQFEAQIAWLRQSDYEVIGLDEGIRRLDERANVANSVVLTFDDGYADFIENAVPVLQRYGFTATLFVVTGRVGRTANWQGSAMGHPLVSLDTLVQLQNMGYTIGSHSVSHTRLTRLTQADLDAEVAPSRRWLDQTLGVAPRAFAYPYGSFKRREIEAVIRAGYACACGIHGWSNTETTNRFALRRIEMWAGYSMREYEALLTARIKWPRWVRAAKHMLGRR